MRAAAVTMGDIRMLYNGLLAPQRVKILGFSLAGDVTEVGSNVRGFKPGDAVYGFSGFRFGAYAECLRLAGKNELGPKPASMSYEEAATIPCGERAALCYLWDAGKVGPGQRVLIAGASGSVGTYAVQLARWLGAEVTGVCSADNAALVLFPFRSQESSGALGQAVCPARSAADCASDRGALPHSRSGAGQRAAGERAGDGQRGLGRELSAGRG